MGSMEGPGFLSRYEKLGHGGALGRERKRAGAAISGGRERNQRQCAAAWAQLRHIVASLDDGPHSTCALSLEFTGEAECRLSQYVPAWHASGILRVANGVAQSKNIV